LKGSKKNVLKSSDNCDNGCDDDDRIERESKIRGSSNGTTHFDEYGIRIEETEEGKSDDEDEDVEVDESTEKDDKDDDRNDDIDNDIDSTNNSTTAEIREEVDDDIGSGLEKFFVKPASEFIVDFFDAFSNIDDGGVALMMVRVRVRIS
jgi:hypothetical protein